MPFINHRSPSPRLQSIKVAQREVAPEMSMAEYARIENAAMRRGQLHKTPPELIFGSILSRARAQPGITTSELMLSLGMTNTAVLQAVRAMVEKGLVTIERGSACQAQKVFPA